jgi:SPOR domain
MARIFRLAGVLLLIAGCAATKKAGEVSASTSLLHQYEATFNPSEFDEPLTDIIPARDTSATLLPGTDSASASPRPPELTQGYRVQVFATTSYDEATSTKTAIEEQFPNEWFYLVYDSPTYKLRGGNFIERYEAERFAKTLTERGYRNAWVVPERVYKYPPPHLKQAQANPDSAK